MDLEAGEPAKSLPCWERAWLLSSGTSCLRPVSDTRAKLRRLLCRDDDFESAFIANSASFQLGYIAIQVVVIFLFVFFVRLMRGEPPAWSILIPCAVLLPARFFVVTLHRRWSHLPLMEVTVLLSVMETMMFWSPRQLWCLGNSVNCLHMMDVEESAWLAASVYVLQLSIWHNIIFLLTFRYSALSGVLCLVAGVTFGRFGNTQDWALYGPLMVGTQAFTMPLALVVKGHLELLQRSQLRTLQKKSQELTLEKILRCQAEFAKEQVEEQIQNGRGPERAFDTLRADQAAWCLKQQKTEAPSLHSAPAALPSSLSTGSAMGQGLGNCLRLDSLVFVEGSTLPVKVQDVRVKQSVLCYDDVSNSMKYTEVADARVLSGPAAWVRVALADGTSLEMTSDHPVQRSPVSGPRSRDTVCAGNLQPNADAVTVLRVVPIPVVNVTPCEEQVTPSEANRVALTLRQPERHSVFVAGKGDTALATMAVGSANAAVSSARKQLREKYTFLSWEEEDHFGAMRRTLSAPALLQLGHLEALQVEESPGLCEPGSISDWTSERSGSSRNSRPISILTGLQPTDTLTADSGLAALSQLLSVRQRGLKSAGSADHPMCKPCVHQNRFFSIGGRPCLKGELCTLCHEEHHDDERFKRRSGAKRRGLRKEAERAASQSSVPSP